MRHLVITIGCEYGAKGNAIGRKIAEDLNIKFYNRDLVDEIIEEVGIPKEIMEKVEEGGTIAGKGAEGDVRGSFSKYADLTDRAIHVQKQIIRKLAEKESCVIIGRCADYALEDFDNCLSVYVHAPFEDRIKRIETEYGIVKEKSKEVLMKKDKQRSSYYNYYSSNKWGDAKSYDLCLNSSYLGIDGSVEMIKKVIDMKESQE